MLTGRMAAIEGTLLCILLIAGVAMAVGLLLLASQSGPRRYDLKFDVHQDSPL